MDFRAGAVSNLRAKPSETYHKSLNHWKVNKFVVVVDAQTARFCVWYVFTIVFSNSCVLHHYVEVVEFQFGLVTGELFLSVSPKSAGYYYMVKSN